MISYFRLFSIAGLAVTLITLNGCGGSSNTSTSNTTPSASTPSTPQTDSAPAPSHSDNHGGETKEASGTTDPDVDYMTSLGLMKGHLLVAKELIDQKQLDQAEPHIGHPVEELYGDIEAELPTRKVPDFKSTLNQLHDSVKAKADVAKIQPQYDAATKAIETAMKGIPADKLGSPQFVVGAIEGLLETADEEYQAAINNGKIVEAIEYQDSRGFVLYAENLFKDVESQLKQKNAEATSEIATNMTELKQAWPSAIPPAQAVKTPEQVSKLVATIKESTGKIGQ
jgi:hypothetical protein